MLRRRQKEWGGTLIGFVNRIFRQVLTFRKKPSTTFRLAKGRRRNPGLPREVFIREGKWSMKLGWIPFVRVTAPELVVDVGPHDVHRSQVQRMVMVERKGTHVAIELEVERRVVTCE